MKLLLVYLFFLLVQLIALFIYFDENKIIAKLVLLFTYMVVIKGFNRKYIIINSIILLIAIIMFYISYYKLKEIKVEHFSNKLKAFKSKEKDGNSDLKQHFKDTNESIKNKNTTFREYVDSFKDYKFTKKVNSSIEALNKVPLYIEKFKELW